MRRNTQLLGIRLLVALNFLPAVFFKFAGVPLSVALFTAMSNAVHGLVSQPVFRLGSGTVETVLVLLFLIPGTARLGAALIAVSTASAPVFIGRQMSSPARPVSSSQNAPRISV